MLIRLGFFSYPGFLVQYPPDDKEGTDLDQYLGCEVMEPTFFYNSYIFYTVSLFELRLKRLETYPLNCYTII